MTRPSVNDRQVYDSPRPAIEVVADAISVSQDTARAVLSALAENGYFVAPRMPTNAMLAAYLNSYGSVSKAPHGVIRGIAKARARWAAMGSSGMAMALSTKKLGLWEPPCPEGPCDACGADLAQTHFDTWECGAGCPGYVEYTASVDRSGEADETRSGSAEGESAVPATPGDAQPLDPGA